MTQIETVISYIDPEGVTQEHVVHAEISLDEFSDEVQEVTEFVTEKGFFLVLEEKHYVFVPSSRVLQIAFSLIGGEGSS